FPPRPSSDLCGWCSCCWVTATFPPPRSILMWPSIGSRPCTNSTIPEDDLMSHLPVRHWNLPIKPGLINHCLPSREFCISFFRSLSVFASSLLMSAAVLAAVPEQAAITQKLQASLPSLQVKTIDATPVKGLYQLETITGELILVSADGKYLVSGDLHRIEDRGVTNLTEERRSAQRLDAIKSLNDKDLVVFPAKGEEKGEVLV